jgi:hypothetical protein
LFFRFNKVQGVPWPRQPHSELLARKVESLAENLFDMQNVYMNISLQAGLQFLKRVILKYMLKNENSITLDCKDVKIHGGINYMVIVIVVEA